MRNLPQSWGINLKRRLVCEVIQSLSEASSQALNKPCWNEKAKQATPPEHSSSDRQRVEYGMTRPIFILLIVVLPIFTTAVAWLLLREPKKNQKSQNASKQHRKSVVEQVLQTRLNAKRDVLWQQLIEDRDLLLKNQIEARHVMTQRPIVIGKATSGKEIARLISQHSVEHLLVCDEDQILQGIVHADDHRQRPRACAAEILCSLQSSVTPKSPLNAAISQLIDQRVSFLPVVDQDVLRGVLTPTDLVLTLHCSLQLWQRVAHTMETSSQRAEILEQTSKSMTETADQLKHQVQRLPAAVDTVIQTGKTDGLVAEIDQMTTAVSNLMAQLGDAQTQIRAQNEQIADLKEPSPDKATGATTREQFDQNISRQLEENQSSNEPLSVILFEVETYQRLLESEGKLAADEQLRLLAECFARRLSPQDNLARYDDNTLAITLPGRTSIEARQLAIRLTDAAKTLLGIKPSADSRMSILSARPNESASELMARAENGIKCETNDLELAATS